MNKQFKEDEMWMVQESKKDLWIIKEIQIETICISVKLNNTV